MISSEQYKNYTERKYNHSVLTCTNNEPYTQDIFMKTLNMILLANILWYLEIQSKTESFLLPFADVLFLSCLSFYSPRQVTAVLFSTRNNLPGPPAYKTLTPGNCIDWQQPLWGRQRDLGVSSSPTGNCFHSHLQGLGWKGQGCKVKYGNKLF